MMKTFQTEGIPNAIKMFEKLLSANGGKFFVGKEVLTIGNSKGSEGKKFSSLW